MAAPAVANAQVLPKELRLSAPPTMPQARSYMFRQPAVNPTYAEGTTVTINIPRLQRSYLTKDSYLRFRVKCTLVPGTRTTYTAITFSAGAYDSTTGLITYTTTAAHGLAAQDFIAVSSAAGTGSFASANGTFVIKSIPSSTTFTVFVGTGLTMTVTGATFTFPYYKPLNIPVLDSPGAFGLFNKIEVYDYLGSTLLESTAQHGALMGLLLDTHTSTDQRQNFWHVASGTRGGEISIEELAPVSVDGALLTGADYTKYFMQKAPSTGEVWWVAGSATSIDVYREYSIPLLSFLGTLSNKFAPLHNGFTIQLTLNNFVNSFGYTKSGNAGALPLGGTPSGTVNSTTTKFELSDVNYICQILELGPVAESMLLSSTQGQPLVVPTKAYRNFRGSFTGGSSSSYKLDLNLNVASLTNILWFMRPAANANNYTKASLGARVRNYLQNWYFQYGSSVLPQSSGIRCRNAGDVADSGTGHTEAYYELMKARHNFANAANFSTIDSFAYCKEVDNSVLAYNTQGICVPKFAAGLDLELVSGKSQDVISGLNTNGMNTSLFLNFDSAYTASTQSVDVDAYCEYDAFINIAPGLATTVSF